MCSITSLSESVVAAAASVVVYDTQQYDIIIKSLSMVLERLVYMNRCTLPQVSTLKFQCMYAPDVSIFAYLNRIRLSNCSNSCFVFALIYLDRIIESRNVTVTSLNIHRLLITCILLATKFLDDMFYDNAFYAKLGGITCVELNSLEIEMLKLINFSLNVDTNVYNHYYIQLINHSHYYCQSSNNNAMSTTSTTTTGTNDSYDSSTSEIDAIVTSATINAAIVCAEDNSEISSNKNATWSSIVSSAYHVNQKMTSYVIM